ncbi:TPA: DEAD/DEAH box helicase [Candidatus Woesearchaeota archaeon]|nr:DEAD/DEAH box helicase [Candidatus Woesearchaeota archaeon]HIH46875.1 DEAD/DEAH box helicase [Candidatus Woesearchaeota archaeon]HII88187.1 DEAD/DEAH box helicase [Candidatus Woesearchaeota archaeon]
MVFKTIKKEIVTALNEHEIHVPTGIQTKTIPRILAGKDVIGISKTGSGKTAAFVIPMLEHLRSDRVIQKLVICPTRELAVQIATEIKKFGKYVQAHVATVYGGASMHTQIEEIRRGNIVVGTPGRLLDHLQRRNLNLSNLNCVVLDEADKMVDMGFINDIRMILNQTPNNRQILLFGATISDEVLWLQKKYMKNSEVVKDELHLKEEVLEQYYYDVEYNEKFSLLVHLLNSQPIEKVIIFCSARSTVELVTKNLKKQNIEADMIHGKLPQSRRLRVIENFNKGLFNILVASAVAARGIDVKNISHVINYDLSKDPQEYVHRVGRTARAGEKGKAITLLCSRDHEAFREVLGKYQMKVVNMPKVQFEKLAFFARERPQHQQFRRGFGRFNRRR